MNWTFVLYVKITVTWNFFGPTLNVQVYFITMSSHCNLTSAGLAGILPFMRNVQADTDFIASARKLLFTFVPMIFPARGNINSASEGHRFFNIHYSKTRIPAQWKFGCAVWKKISSSENIITTLQNKAFETYSGFLIHLIWCTLVQ